jgi:hypothetical protein
MHEKDVNTEVLKKQTLKQESVAGPSQLRSIKLPRSVRISFDHGRISGYASVSADTTTAMQPSPNVDARIDTIVLFGSQKLMRDSDTRTWLFASATTKPKRLSRRESMFINAALHAAGGK